MRPPGATISRLDWLPAEARRLTAFLLVGGLNTLVGYALFAGFVLLGFGMTQSLISSTALGVLFNFQSIGRLVFRSGNPKLLPRFAFVYVLQFAINLTLLHALRYAGLAPLLAQLILLPGLALASYFAMRHFVFGAAK